MTIAIEQFGCRSDNYGVLVHDPASGETASIDAPEADPILAALERRGWRLTHLLVTHHHHDHTDGIDALKRLGEVEVIGPEAEQGAIRGLSRTVRPGETLDVCGDRVAVIDARGHTNGQVAYHFTQAKRLFAADCLFSLGCGRVFEGTMADMHGSLARLAALPADTMVHCGHEYTASNAAFALTVDPDNAALQRRAAAVREARERGEPTVPVRLGDELETNPFLRPHDPAIRRTLGMEDASDAAVFAALRRRKDAA